MSTVNTSKKNLLNGRKLWFVLAIGLAVVAAGFVLTILLQVTAKDTYYVLNKDIPARTAITPDLLAEFTTSRGSVPPAALSIGELTNGERFSLYSLKAGDILTESNTGDLLSISEGLPEDFVVASFIAEPSAAAGGNVKRGDYIDIIALVDDAEVTGSNGSSATYVLQRALVVDATLDLDSYTSDGEDGAYVGGDGVISENTGDPAMRSGIPTLFTVGLSPENAARLALATEFKLFVVLSSAESSNDGIVPDDVPAISLNDLWNNPRNAGEGTDNTFGQGGSDVTRPDEVDDEPSSPSKPDADDAEADEPTVEEPVNNE